MFIEIKSEAQFEEEIKSGKVLVDFNATWCGPCQMLKPSVERLGERDDIKVLSVDTDENPSVAAKFDIYSIPTLLLFKDGVSVRKNVGFIPEPALKNFAEVE